jgi:chemotaxis protein MotB
VGKKKKHPEHENLERWLVSYADFITLLFATFTALYAIATAKLAKEEDVGKAIKEGFEQQSVETVLKGISSVLQGKSTPTDHPNPAFEQTGRGEGVIGAYDSMTFMPGEVKALETLIDEITEAVKEAAKEGDTEAESPVTISKIGADADVPPAPQEGPASGPTRVVLKGVEIALQERGVRISFDSSLLFAPASAQLAAGHTRLLDAVANRLVARMGDHLIYIEGHTDSSPMHSAIYPSNWELSAARASTVVRRLISKHKMPAGRLVAVGYGDTRAVSSNATAEGRARNRRIDIIIYSKMEAMKADVGRQAKTEHSLLKAPLAQTQAKPKNTPQHEATAHKPAHKEVPSQEQKAPVPKPSKITLTSPVPSEGKPKAIPIRFEPLSDSLATAPTPPSEETMAGKEQKTSSAAHKTTLKAKPHTEHLKPPVPAG